VVRRFVICFCLLALLPACLSGQTIKKKKSSAAAHRSSAAKSPKERARLHRMHRAFVASADLKPMAQQLLENRTSAAYAGVEEYAHRHRTDDAGPLAWFVLAYAHFLDKDYPAVRKSLEHSTSLEPLMGDYITWLRAGTAQGEANQQEIQTILDGFETRYSDSLHLHDATLMYANSLVASGKSGEAITYLEKHRTPLAPDTELALAGAYQTEGLKDKAREVLRRIYFEMPTSEQAGQAFFTLQTLGENPPAGTYDQRHARAELLFKARKFQDAANELGQLIEQTPPDKMAAMQVELASALYRARHRDDAQRLFDASLANPNTPVDSKAQTLYFMAEIARDKDDRGKHAEYLSQLRTLAPDSSWMGEALLSAGNMYMLKNDYETAVKFYSEIYQRQQNGRFSPYAHWKAAWLTYRMGKRDEAKKLFEEQLALYPSSNEVPAAIYWRGRMAEEDGDKPVARAYYQKLSDNYRYYYYANLGRDRLAKIGIDEIGDPAVLYRLPTPNSLPHGWEAPEDNVRVQKAHLLENAAMFDFAVKELQAAAPGNAPWLANELAQLYGEQGSYIRAIESLKRAVPGYFSAEISQIPRPVWEGLFPRPYWDDLKRGATQNRLDPHLVASLIRQESEFNPQAISRANAMGLMQLLPGVGKGMAKELKIHHFSTDALLTPTTNLQLGTRYFKHMVDHYDGQVEYALAAYNAGTDRVDDWRKNGNFKSVEEFVESIPFTETREYVQAIMRNAVLYKLLYPRG